MFHNSLKTNLIFNIRKLEDFFKLELENDITKDHKVASYVLLFITEGTGKHSIDFTDFQYSKATVLAIRKDQFQKFYPNKEVKGFLICFKEEFLNSYLNEIEVAKTIQMFNEMITSPKTQLNEIDYKNISSIIRHIENDFLNVNDAYTLKIIRSLLHVLIMIIYRKKSEGYNKVQLSKYLKEFIKFQNMLEQDYCKTKKVIDYAHKLGFSTKKLNTIVKYIANKPAKAFIDDTVIVKIKELLLHSNDSIKEIAYKVGFNDPTNLYKYFRKFTNTTPEKFRKADVV